MKITATDLKSRDEFEGQLESNDIPFRLKGGVTPDRIREFFYTAVFEEEIKDISFTGGFISIPQRNINPNDGEFNGQVVETSPHEMNELTVVCIVLVVLVLVYGRNFTLEFNFCLK